MTTEEKAKAYDEALKRTKQKIDADLLTEDDLSYIFPALRDSEDERTRKELISMINECTNWAHKKEYIAYLKKQKNASKAIETVEKIDKYIDEHVENAHDMKDSHPDKKYCQGIDDTLAGIAWILQDVYSNEKQKESLRDFIDNFPYSDVQKEQKPKRERKKPKESWLEKAKYELAHEEELLIKRQKEMSEIRALKNKEQKPLEWSEEDKGILLSIKCVIDSVWHNFHYDCSKEELKEMWNWLDVLWQRVEYSQPKQEWSEEDEKHLNWVIEHFRQSGELYHDLIDWLKSLRPQPKPEVTDEEIEEMVTKWSRSSWKPSEEQMEALRWVAYENGNSSLSPHSISNKALSSLYEQLKKL